MCVPYVQSKCRHRTAPPVLSARIDRAFAGLLDRLVSPVAMEFGLFIQAHVPISDTERDPVGRC